jgi:hypothetical protein
MAARIRRIVGASDVPAQDGDGAAGEAAGAETDGAADTAGALTDGAADADGATDPEAAGDPLAEADGEAEPDGAALTDGTGDGVGFGLRNPPRPPSSPNRRIAANTITDAMTK